MYGILRQKEKKKLERKKGRDRDNVCECVGADDHSFHLHHSGLLSRWHLQEVKEMYAVMGVTVGKDDTRRGTSRCKDLEVEHTWWLARSTLGGEWREIVCIGWRQILWALCIGYYRD